MRENTKYHIFTGIIILFIILLKIYLTNITFFWDSIACLSRPACFFYENHLQNFIYSGRMDTGDPHVIPYYLATVWTLFGKSLLISHLAFLPIVTGVVYQIILLSKKISAPIDQKNAFIAFLFVFFLVLANPVIFTQLLLLSIDLWVIFFATYCLNQMLANKKTGLSIAFIGLCLTNRRGMIVAAVLMIAYVIKIFLLEKRTFSIKEFVKAVAPTLPACFTVLAYLFFRFYYHGWVFSNADSAWASTSEFVNFYGFIRNIVVFIWWNLNFGMIGLWVIILFMFVKFGYKRLFNSQTSFLWTCYFLLQFAFACVTLPLTNPFGMRYFAVPFILLSIIVAKLVFDLFDKKRALIISSVLIIVLATGNLWLYPEKISQNWDSTLKHLPFYSLRKECFDYMEKHAIPYDQTAAGFSLSGNQPFTTLLDEEKIISSQITEDTKFFLYSNISNLNDELIDEFHNPEKWTNIKTFEKGGVFIQILKKNDGQK